VQPGDADVHDELGAAAQVAGGAQGLPGDRKVGGAGGDDQDQAAVGLGRLGWPRQEVGLFVVVGVPG